MLRRTVLRVSCWLAFLLAVSAAADDLDKLRERLAEERDVYDRAKITVKIGDALLDQVLTAYKAGNLEEGNRLLVDYRRAIRTAHKELKESGRDARRRPKGFKDLEIHIRKSQRRLEDMEHLLNYEQRGPLEETIAALDAIRRELLDNLMQRDQEKSSG